MTLISLLLPRQTLLYRHTVWCSLHTSAYTSEYSLGTSSRARNSIDNSNGYNESMSHDGSKNTPPSPAGPRSGPGCELDMKGLTENPPKSPTATLELL